MPIFTKIVFVEHVSTFCFCWRTSTDGEDRTLAAPNESPCGRALRHHRIDGQSMRRKPPRSRAGSGRPIGLVGLALASKSEQVSDMHAVGVIRVVRACIELVVLRYPSPSKVSLTCLYHVANVSTAATRTRRAHLGA